MSQTAILKNLQMMLATSNEIFEVPRSLVEDIYTLLTEPYQLCIEDIISEEESRKIHEI